MISTPLRIALAVSLLVGITAPNAQASVYADSASVENVTFFGSGILTGAPDGGGAFLSNTFDPPTLLGSITFGFAGGLIDGAGDDIEIIDVGSTAAETYDVAVSSDGVSFTSLGGYSSADNLIDVGGAFGGIFYYVRVTNTAVTNSPDIDAGFGFHEATIIPLPAGLPLLLGALGLAGLVARRRSS